MRVTPPPPVVPLWRVVNSRIRFSLPISSALSSPAYLRSCGWAPTEANWKTRFRSPIRVRPSMTACGPTVVPAPISTWGPITA